MSDEHQKGRDQRLVEEETLTMVRSRKPPSSEATTRRMLRDEALEAAVRGEVPDRVHEWNDDWEDDIPEDLPELAGTAQMPAHIERRALPFRRRDGGGREHDVSREAPFTGGATPEPGAWHPSQADPSLDVTQLPSALAPSDPPPARQLRGDVEEGTRGVIIAFAVFVVLALTLVAVAALGV